MSQRYDLMFQLQLSSCRLNIEKIDFSIVIKFFCDVINVEVLYFQITCKFDIFRFFLSPKLQHLETSFFQQKIEKNIRKKMMKKKIFDQKSRSSIFSNHGSTVVRQNVRKRQSKRSRCSRYPWFHRLNWSHVAQRREVL